MKRITFSLLEAVIVLSLPMFAASGCQCGMSQELEHGHPTDEMPALSAVALSEGEKLRVVATTSIVADVVQNVGGDRIDLTTLLPLGADPHAFEPTPQDVAAVAGAHIVFANGAGLEAFLDDLLESAGENVPVVPVSYGVELLTLDGKDEHGGGMDPHIWFDPNNVLVWTRNIEHALGDLDPGNAAAYAANAATYEAELIALDAWIKQQVAQVPEANRRLVTDHASFAYFARRYGFEQVGAVFPGYSTLAEPSAQELAELEEAIREHGVKAVFVGLTVNPALAERVAEDTDTRLVFLYTGSLSGPDGPASDYLAFMKYNVSAIVEALR
jgi:manganese/iron transport system substrate-binding protein